MRRVLLFLVFETCSLCLCFNNSYSNSTYYSIWIRGLRNLFNRFSVVLEVFVSRTIIS